MRNVVVYIHCQSVSSNSQMGSILDSNSKEIKLYLRYRLWLHNVFLFSLVRTVIIFLWSFDSCGFPLLYCATMYQSFYFPTLSQFFLFLYKFIRVTEFLVILPSSIFHKKCPVTRLFQPLISFHTSWQFLIYSMHSVGACSSIVGWGSVLQAVRSRVLFLMSLDFTIDSLTMALGSTQPLTEMSTRNLPGGKGWPLHKADNLTTMCEPIV
jgi:hypothetical protein